MQSVFDGWVAFARSTAPIVMPAATFIDPLAQPSRGPIRLISAMSLEVRQTVTAQME
jgi:hypothetical protein